jgi:hypothetical protein
VEDGGFGMIDIPALATRTEKQGFEPLLEWKK